MRRTLLILLLLPALLLPGIAARMLCLCGIARQEHRPRCCTSCQGETPAAPTDPQRDPGKCEGCVAEPLVFDLGSRPELPSPEPLALVLVPELLPEVLGADAPRPGRPVVATAHPPPGAAFRLPLRI